MVLSHWRRAESEAYQFRPSLFAMLVLDVFDQALPIAQLKQIELVHQVDDEARKGWFWPIRRC